MKNNNEINNENISKEINKNLGGLHLNKTTLALGTTALVVTTVGLTVLGVKLLGHRPPMPEQGKRPEMANFMRNDNQPMQNQMDNQGMQNGKPEQRLEMNGNSKREKEKRNLILLKKMKKKADLKVNQISI